MIGCCDWDVEGGVSVLWSFESTLSGERGTRPVAAKPLWIFDKDIRIILVDGLLDRYR